MALTLPVYLDNHATTRVDPRVVEAMVPYLSTHYGNAASRQHEFGWKAEAAVESARKKVAALIGASAQEIVFTSGATESINLALKGSFAAAMGRRRQIVTAATEHRAVLDTCRRLEQDGVEVRTLPVDRHGMVSPDDVDEAIGDETLLVSIMWANNEIGTLAPVAAIGALCKVKGVLFHTDATQAVGRVPVGVTLAHVDMMSFNAHKMYGPKGIGALYLRAAQPKIRLLPLMDGGGHERGLRSGTLDVPAIAGFGAAAEIAMHEMIDEAARTRTLRDRLVEGITGSVEGVRLHGHPVDRLPNNANLGFEGIAADDVMMAMKDIAVSSGSACSSDSPEPSHVLRALGYRTDEARAALRFGLGRFTTREEIEYAITRVTDAVAAVRARKFHSTMA
jgi:cysteine desulfurase